MKGKAIYEPKGAAAEYAKYACNFHIGCSNSCTYCFNKRWGWGNVPKLKSCFKDENHALEVFEKELKANLPELQKHGVFFSFTTDPMLNRTIDLTYKAVNICVENCVPVKILTKRAEWVYQLWVSPIPKLISFGFTLTGHDDLEPNASTNAERIEAMRKLHEAGFKTWASVEPVIDFVSSAEMMRQTHGFCDLYKVGLLKGKNYDKWECENFISYCLIEFENSKIYFKESILKQAGISRLDLPGNCVDRNFNIREL